MPLNARYKAGIEENQQQLPSKVLGAATVWLSTMTPELL